VVLRAQDVLNEHATTFEDCVSASHALAGSQLGIQDIVSPAKCRSAAMMPLIANKDYSAAKQTRDQDHNTRLRNRPLPPAPSRTCLRNSGYAASRL